MIEKPKLDIPISEPFMDLWEPFLRFIFYISGRAAGKSWGVADAFLVLAMQRPHLFLMTREIQKSLKDSSYRLLSNRIRYFGWERDDLFTIKRDGIVCANGSEFLFSGLQGHTVDSIKSYEGVDYCYVEEAQSVSRYSLDILIPTIRKEIPPEEHPTGKRFKSKVIFSMNPRFETDAAYEDAVGYEKEPEPDVRVYRLNWRDNEFITQTSLDDIDRMRRRNPREFEHVYEGGLLRFSEAAVYQNWEIGQPVIPANAQRIMGADWGFSQDPAALISAWIWEDNIYIEEESVGIKVENDELPALFAGEDRIMIERGQKPRWENTHGFIGVSGSQTHEIIADNARPETINHVRKFGFRVKAAKKGANSVVDGIAFIRAHKIWVHPNCTNSIRELTLYQHKVDKDDPRIVLPEIEDKNNHCMDALRYATEGKRKINAPSGATGAVVAIRYR